MEILENVETALQTRFAGIFRRMWFSYNTKSNIIQVIAFPVDKMARYRIFTKSKIEVFRRVGDARAVDVDIIERFIREEIAT